MRRRYAGIVGNGMNELYKIESYCENSVKQLAEFIKNCGGQCVVRGWAVISDHVFSEVQTQKVLHLVARISDAVTEDDHYSWSTVYKKAA